jgi:hypothetical protein
MNTRSLLKLADEYASLLEDDGAVVCSANLDRRLSLPEDRSELLNHARWQIEVARRVAHLLGGDTTAVRMLGAAQGILVSTGLLTIRDVWEHNDRWLSASSIRAFETALSDIQSAPAESTSANLSRS